jgi:hypothetical protein
MIYLVTWQIEVDADSPRDAAKKALEIQRDPTSIATVFNVTPADKLKFEEVDLSKLGRFHNP